MSLFATVERKWHHPDAGLLLWRALFGGLLLFYGTQKIMGGKPVFAFLGGTLETIGVTNHFITAHPAYWGLMSALTETFGGLFLVLGFCFRPAAFCLLLNMAVATAYTWRDGADFSPANVLPFVFCLAVLGLLLTGPGRYALQKSGGARAAAKPGG